MDTFFSVQIITFICLLGFYYVSLNISVLVTEFKEKKPIKHILKTIGLGFIILLIIYINYGPMVFVFQLVKSTKFEEGCLNMSLVYSSTVVLFSLFLFFIYIENASLKRKAKKRNIEIFQTLDKDLMNLENRLDIVTALIVIFVFFGNILFYFSRSFLSICYEECSLL